MAEDEVVKSFKDLGLRDELLEACDNLGWKQPSKIQVEAIPHGIEGKDLIGLAQTGSGKTGAFALPIIQALLETPQIILCLCAVPHTLVGGVDHVQQSIALAKRPHIVLSIGNVAAVYCALFDYPFDLFGTDMQVEVGHC